MRPSSRRSPARSASILQRLYEAPLAYHVGSAIVLLAHIVFRHPDYLLRQGFLAGGMGVLTFVVLLRTLRSERHELPLLAWAMLQYYVYWAAPVFYEGESLRLFPFSLLRCAGAMDASMVGDLLFMVALVAAFALTLRLIPGRTREPISRPMSQPLLLLAAFASLAMSYELIWYERSGASFFYVAGALFSPTLFHLFLIFERQQHRTARWFDLGYVAFVVTSVAVGLMSGRMEQALYPVVVASLTALARTRRVPVGYVAAVLVMMVVMQPVKLAYRELIGFRTNYYQRMTPGECVDAMGRSIEARWTGGSTESVYTDNVDFLGRRLNERTSNAVVHYLVPDMVPFDRGGTLYPVIYAFIPRVLWNQKPAVTELTNNHFAVSLGFLTELEARDTTKTIPIAAEAYFNYGWPGIIAIGLFCGFLFAVLSRLFSPSSRLFYAGTFLVVIKMRPYDGLAMVICDSIKPIVFTACWTLLFDGLGRFHRGWFTRNR